MTDIKGSGLNCTQEIGNNLNTKEENKDKFNKHKELGSYLKDYMSAYLQSTSFNNKDNPNSQLSSSDIEIIPFKIKIKKDSNPNTQLSSTKLSVRENVSQENNKTDGSINIACRRNNRQPG